MFSFDTKEIEMDANKNFIVTKKIEIDKNLDCFLLLSSNNKKLVQPIMNKIVDLVLDHVSLKDTYNSFSIALENVNFFIKNIRKKEECEEDISMILWVLENNTLHFSKIGQASAYLINKENDVIEITENNEKMETFEFISSGILSNTEKVIFSNIRLEWFVNESDFEELSQLESIEKINQNIVEIAREEKISDNLKLLTFEYSWDETTPIKKINPEKIKHLFYRLFDNYLSKEIFARVLLLKEKIEAKGKIVKNTLFVSGILVSAVLLFKIISLGIGTGVESSTEDYKTKLLNAKEYVKIANQNFSNPEAFDFNMTQAETLVNEVKQKQLFLNDVDAILTDISLAKKQFNGIETFETTAANMIFKWDFKDGIRVLEMNKKLYVLGKSALYGPVNPGWEIQTHIFQELDIKDEFLDATVAGENIIIHTQKGRMIRFTKDGKFAYVNVLEQNNWDTSKFIESYNGNIYITNKDSNQVFMHSPALGSFNTGIPYLNDADSKMMGNILSIGIDGGIYILKNDLKLYKFFRSPKYRLESIVLNKLPKNYAIENNNTHVKIITKPTLNNIYFHLNNKIWIFKPNTRLTADVKSLEYLGQIEGKNEAFISFEVLRDGEITILTKSWIYKLNFESKDGTLLIR